MSPNEFQLRAALHDGEGDAPDPDRLIAHAVGVRVARRRRLNTVVAGGAAVAVVGLCATALVALGSDHGGGGSLADRAAVAGGAAAGSAATPARPARSAQASSASGSATSAATGSGTACPAMPQRYLLPGGGGSGQFGSTEKLFADTVTSLRLCGYPLRASTDRTTAVVGGSAARAIITALDAGSSRRPVGRACPANINYLAGTVQITGVTSAGRATKPVVVTLGCLVTQATNGTAVRYLGDIPKVLAQLVSPVSLKSTAGRVPGKITISPVR